MLCYMIDVRRRHYTSIEWRYGYIVKGQKRSKLITTLIAVTSRPTTPVPSACRLQLFVLSCGSNKV